MNANERLKSAPMPTAKTLKARTSLPRQALRFVSFSFRMLKMVTQGHH